jgi:type I restriction enzyme S subunit
MGLRVYPIGTVLVSCSADLGRCAITSAPLVTNQTFIGLVPSERLNAEFLYYLMGSLAKLLNNLASGATITYLSRKKFEELEVAIPSISDQKRIVAILDEAFEAIDRAKQNAEKNLQNARELFNSYLQNIFSNPGKDWEERNLEEVCDFQNGYAFKSTWYAENGNGIRLLRNANVSHGTIDWTEGVVRLPESKAIEFERFRLNKNDIVLSLDRPIISTGLKAAILREEDIPSLLLQRVLRITSPVILHEYIFHWLFSSHFKDAIDPGRSLGVPHISGGEVGNVRIAYPNRVEQERVVSSVEAMGSFCRQLQSNFENTIEALEELKQSVLRKAFSGELV